MAYLLACGALLDVYARTFARSMTSLVALKAEFRGAFELVMLIVATQDAVKPFAFVRAHFRQMAELATVPTLDRRVQLCVVPRDLSLQPLIAVISHGSAAFHAARDIVSFRSNLLALLHLAVELAFFLVANSSNNLGGFIHEDVPASVHATAEESSRVGND